MKPVFLFPGQGSQYVGMGKALYTQFDAAKKTFQEASDALGYDMAKLCLEDPEERLNQTEYTQPALLTTSIAIWRSLEISADMGLAVAGHSLGEYSALVAAGAMSFSDAVSVVSQRGRFMQEAVPEGCGSMAAVVGLSGEIVTAVCNEVASAGDEIFPANFNAPDQVVIAGRQKSLEKAMALLSEKGAKRVIPLSVSVPSHTPLMKPACARLKEVLYKIAGNDITVPLINNLEAKAITKWSEARASLVDQLAFPLLWDQTIQTMKTMGADFFIEIGPSRVLSGLMKRIDRTARVINAEDPEGIIKAREAIGGLC
ncbi:MAG: ACP S-malonyltransferase [Nitrospirota bacterium]